MFLKNMLFLIKKNERKQYQQCQQKRSEFM